jgi:excinuclease ABC subunit B
MMKELGFATDRTARRLEGRPQGSHPFTPSTTSPDFRVRRRVAPDRAAARHVRGDRSRKQTLVTWFGCRRRSTTIISFDRVPAEGTALFRVGDARPVRAPPLKVIAEQLIRPTFVVDPEVELQATKNQIDDLLNEIKRREEAGERVGRDADQEDGRDATDYLLEAGVRPLRLGDRHARAIQSSASCGGSTTCRRREPAPRSRPAQALVAARRRTGGLRAEDGAD